MYCSRTRSRPGRSTAVHRSAQYALQIPVLLYGAVTTHTVCGFPSRNKQNFQTEGCAGMFSAALPL